jgi:hypothetical protein
MDRMNLERDRLAATAESRSGTRSIGTHMACLPATFAR